MKYLLSGIILLVVIVGAVVFATRPVSAPDTEVFDFAQTEFDFGVLKQSGGIVTHDFPFTYNGTETITVTGLPASCGCTSATINSSVLTPGTQGVITVSFDPNLHEEPEGRFYKTVSILTDPAMSDLPELKIWAEIDLDLGPEAYKEAHEGELQLLSEDLTPDKTYRTISASTLEEALEDQHFYLVDVHIPEQVHIEGTNAFIPYDQIADYLNELPEDKDAPIVLYCRSGSMSQEAAQTLVDLGYTNVMSLDGGAQAFDQLTE